MDQRPRVTCLVAHIDPDRPWRPSRIACVDYDSRESLLACGYTIIGIDPEEERAAELYDVRMADTRRR